LAIFQAALRCEICIWLSMFHTFTITQQNYAEDEQKRFIILKMKIYAILVRRNPTHTI
jgi:hypothetical protein